MEYTKRAELPYWHTCNLIDEPISLPDRKINRDQYINDLINSGLDGIEACYTYDKTSYSGNQSKQEIFDEIVKKYKNCVSILSGGSDYHADDQKGVQNARRIGECGVSLEYFYHNDLQRRLSDDFR